MLGYPPGRREVFWESKDILEKVSGFLQGMSRVFKPASLQSSQIQKPPKDLRMLHKLFKNRNCGGARAADASDREVIGSVASQAEGNGNCHRRWGRQIRKESEESPAPSVSEAASHHPQ